MALAGIWGRPYLALDDLVDLEGLDAVHEEVCLGLTRVAPSYTGGSHRSMGIVPEPFASEPWVDYGEVLRALPPADLALFHSLGDDPGVAPDERDVGEEREVPLSRRQMLWLEYRHRVYFPWAVYFEMVPNRYWTEKSDLAGKAFTREARAIFPRTIALLERLPFVGIGRANIMGLRANDFGTVHKDAEPSDQPVPPHFITVSPAPGKRLFLWDADARAKTPVEGRAVWFNDADYHGVEADPFFRYSIRVDGVFREDFLAALRERAAASGAR
jgi:hypothetical protein